MTNRSQMKLLLCVASPNPETNPPPKRSDLKRASDPASGVDPVTLTLWGFLPDRPLDSLPNHNRPFSHLRFLSFRQFARPGRIKRHEAVVDRKLSLELDRCFLLILDHLVK